MAVVLLAWTGAAFTQSAAAPAPVGSSGQAPASGAAAAAPRFDVLEYEVEGNTVLQVEAVEQAVMPHLGPQRGMAAVEAARDALDRAYQQGGWLSVVVDIPEQQLRDGVVRLRVTEGRVGSLRITGARYFAQGWIRHKVPALTPGEVPNFNAVQAQLATVNRTEDRRVQPVLRPGRVPGTLEVELKVQDQLPLSGSVELSNRHAKDTVPWRLSATVRYDNLFQREHSLALTLSTAPEDTRQARVLALNYSVPTDDGGAWLGYLVASDSLVEPLGSSVIGKGSSLGLRRVLPLPAPRGAGGRASLQHSLTLGLDYKDLQQRVLVGTDTISSPLRYLPLSLLWSGSTDFDRSSAQASLGLTLAARGLLPRTVDCADLPQDQFACSRRNADGSFAVLKGDWRQRWRLGSGGWGLITRAGLQLASGPLVSGEQYALGGADTVRGYRESELVVDQALLGQLALRSPNLSRLVSGPPPAPVAGAAADLPAGPGGLTELVASAWLEAAHGQLIDPALGQAASAGLAGAGMGLQWRLGARWDGQFDLAWPLRLTAQVRSHSPRLHARMQLRF